MKVGSLVFRNWRRFARKLQNAGRLARSLRRRRPPLFQRCKIVGRSM